VGDDAQPCSRVAPCKTWAGAISKTAAFGEIDALDPGGYGAVTITKSITLSGRSTHASTLVSGTSGFIIVAGSTDRVIIDNIEFNGLGTGTNGIDIRSAATVRIQHVHIFGFTNGVSITTSATGAPQPRVTINDAEIQGSSSAGVMLAPTMAAGARVTVSNSQLDGNNCGIVVGSSCGGPATGSPALANVVNTTLIDNAVGVDSNGVTAAAVIAKDSIFGNSTGLFPPGGGQIISFGDNYVFGNGTNGAPTSTVAPKARDLNRIWRGLVRRMVENKTVKQRHRR
jgi:hypothetical protein